MAEVSIHTLPFKVFKQIILTGDLTLLGESEGVDLPALWEDVLQQYAEALGEVNADGYLSTRRELLYYQSQRYLVHFYAEQLSELYVPKWAEALNKITRANFTFDPKNREEYHKLLQRSVKRSKGAIDLQIIFCENRLRELEKRAEGKALKPTEEFFAKVLLNLHEWSNWQFEDDKITTYQYCELSRRYSQHLDYLQSQNNGRSKRA
jgi:hypothetical protein